MKTVCLLCANKVCTMAKTSSILTRGVLTSDKKKLQRIAKGYHVSLNTLMIIAIENYLNDRVNLGELNIPQKQTNDS